VIDALSDPFDALAIATGNEQAIESDWKISVPDNIIGKGLDFISRISGVYSPYSWIPGSYFTKVEEQSSINQASRGDGEYSDRGTLLPDANKRSSELFISNTGRGQTKRLFKSLSLNVFAPDYTDNNRAFGLKAPSGNYYVGSKTQDPKDIVAPPNELPIDQFGNRVRTPVRGYSELAKLYEGNFSFKFGLNGTKFLRVGTATNSSYDAPRLQGGFTWTSLDGLRSAGRFVSEGGGLGSVDSNFTSNVQSSFDAGVSTQYDFKKGSILDDTQKLIDAAEGLQGDARLQHVGNAINQVSKVFNDGTREITKGSRVYKYEDQSTGEIKGMEYCRVFTKDIPYFSNSELQKEDGMTNQNRRFQYSVLDNTYNLNIAPFRDDDSTNIQADKVKKYMFSIENLAWRTSSKPGFTYSDLPVCERGPNGGRIMWFPPYDMKVSETNSTNWTSNEFLGRPEPIFTYNNTTRQGSLSWKIVVDHPSILNAIVDKELAGQNTQRVNDIVDSFFAGCRKYDIYELAQRFPQFTLKDIYEIVTETTDVKTYENFSKDIERINLIEQDPVIEEYTPEVQVQDYEYEFYFDNDVPGPRSVESTTTTEDYATTLSTYIGKRSEYLQNADTGQTQQVQTFFDTFLSDGSNNIIQQRTQELVAKIKKALDKGGTINMTLVGSASAPNSVEYNESLSKRRIDSVKKYLFSFFDLSKYEDRFSITEDARGEEETAIPGDGSYGSVNCTDTLTGNDTTYSYNAMACRAVVIKTIEEVPSPPEQRVTEVPPEETIITDTVTGKTEVIRQKETKITQPRNEVAKIIVKKLLTECDYFNMMREETPRVYEGIKDKIKYFQPVFHSITPEGLNSRLTFLQQCLRPGDTIPVIGEDGKPREGDVKNTAFGAPPICVLRIGDFYHTKIAIQQMSINYEPLTFDLNPEGIGVQPMIADINMSFYFIGGQGIKEPVSRLQNALSFNYYGNTEVYDDRSVVTEDRSELNREILDAIEDSNNFSLTENGQVERSEEAGDTIGEITSTTIGDYLQGDINYKSIVNDYVSKSQSYTQNILNTLETITKDQSTIGMYYFSQTRNYQDGYITGYLDGNDELFSNIFGKPSDIPSRTIELETKLNQDVDNNTNPFLSLISLQNFKNSDIRKFKKNLKSFIKEYIGYYQSTFNSLMFDLLETQTEFVRVNDKLNLITTETDGYKNKQGRSFIFELSATTDVDVSSTQANTQEELLADIQTVGFDLQAFYDEIFETNGLLPKKDNLYKGFLSGEFDTEPQTRFCTISYGIMLEDPEYVIDRILGEELIQKEDWIRYVNEIVYGRPEIPNNLSDILGTEGMNQPILPSQPGLLDVYKELQQNSLNSFKNFTNNNNVQKFTLYEPFNPDKVRNFTYIEKPEEVADDSKVIYFKRTFTGGQNSGPLNEYNEKYSFNL
jgi:outer membrane protein OmpA-like peptidoglycan-associated protein